jgi:hypothetical protein
MKKITQRFALCTALTSACLITAATAAAQEAPSDQVKPRVEVGFVVDTTGSMSGLIDGAKKKIWSIANTIVDQNPDAEILIGLVGYRDLNDDYVTKLYPLTADIQDIYAKLLTFQADGGGDTPESVNKALDVAVTQLGWSGSSQKQSKTTRVLFLVGDAPPHMDYKKDRKYPEVIKEAVSKNIVVNTVQAGNMESTTTYWKEMAKLGGGEYLAIPQDGGQVISIDTPYDEKMRAIQLDLNKTMLPYGSTVQQDAVKNKALMYEAATRASSADMSSYVSKSAKGKSIVTGSGDLVADVQEGKANLSSVPKAELPQAMQSMNPEEQKKYLDERASEREKLSRELKNLVMQRDQYLRDKEKTAPSTTGDSFDQSVSKTLQKQIR